jgi:hypothetical protein
VQLVRGGRVTSNFLNWMQICVVVIRFSGSER